MGRMRGWGGVYGGGVFFLFEGGKLNNENINKNKI